MAIPPTRILQRNGMGRPGAPGKAISARLSRELVRMDVERARWIHGKGAAVRTLADMSPEEVAALERQYGARVAK